MAGDVTRIGRKTPANRRGIVAVQEEGSREHALRMTGKSWGAVAKACGHDSAGAAIRARERYLQRCGLELSAEKRSEALAMEVERLDTLQAAYWDAAVAGWPPREDEPPRRPDLRAAELVLKVIAQRSKLLGLEEPDPAAVGQRTVVVTGNTDQYVASLKALIAGTSEVVDADVVEDN